MAGLGSCLTNPLACPGQIIGGVASDAASSGLKALADGAFSWLGKILKLLTTFWIQTPAPDLTSSQSAVRLLHDELQPLAMFALVVGLLFAAARLMWTARSGEPGAFSQAMKGIAQTITVTGAGALIVSVLLKAFDQWANHILNVGFDGVGVGKQMLALSAGASPAGQLGSLFSAVLFSLAALASLGQFALMLIRDPVVVLLCVAWPITAASAVTKEGSESFRRLTGWLLSWSLYKLVAAIIYATAFAMFGDSKDELGTVEGAILLIVAIFALPALIRLITPAAQAIPSGGGQLMMAGASAGGQILGATAYSRAGKTAQNHQVGSAQPFSGSAGAPVGAAASNGNSGGSAGARGSAGTAGSAGAGLPGGAGAAAAAAGPVGAAAAAGGIAKQRIEGASGAVEGTGADG